MSERISITGFTERPIISECYNEDCAVGMKRLIEKGVKADWLITDPPYGIGVGSLSYTNGVAMVGKALAKRRDYSGMGEWDNERIDPALFDLMFQISKNQIIFGGNYYTDILPATKSWVVWDKRCNNKLRDDFADCELAWCSKGVARVFRYMNKGMLQGDMKHKDPRFHPTQKPRQIWEQLLDYYTKKGDLIVDPFAGSQSLRIACHRRRRSYIGFEINKEFFDKGQKWYEQEIAQMDLFDLL